MIVQFGGAFFDTTPLSLITWIKIILIGTTVVIISEIVKVIQRKSA
jgi:Ca2+-transporting ATPase